jgi:hypothetical protein
MMYLLGPSGWREVPGGCGVLAGEKVGMETDTPPERWANDQSHAVGEGGGG